MHDARLDVVKLTRVKDNSGLAGIFRALHLRFYSYKVPIWSDDAVRICALKSDLAVALKRKRQANPRGPANVRFRHHQWAPE